MGLSRQQQKVLADFEIAAAGRGASPVEHKALVEAGLVESNLSNPSGGDGDSAGSLQQRPSWGSHGRRTNPRLAADKFLREARKLKRPGISAGELAQLVQRSAFPERYNQRSGEADAILGRKAGSLPRARTAGTPPSYQRATSKTDVEGAILDSLMAGKRGRQGKTRSRDLLDRLDSGSYTTETPGRWRAGTAPKSTGTPQATGSVGDLKPGGGWDGTEGPIIALSKFLDGYNLTTTSGKRDRLLSASGNVSDHAKANKHADARDKSGSVADMDRAAVALARRLGIKDYRQGQKLEATVVKGGIRYQVLYRTNVGGNHFDHIHVGAARVR